MTQKYLFCFPLKIHALDFLKMLTKMKSMFITEVTHKVENSLIDFISQINVGCIHPHVDTGVGKEVVIYLGRVCAMSV